MECIKKSPEYEVMNEGKDKYFVSEEIISIYSMGRFFQKRLQSYIEVSENDFLSISDETIGINDDLPKLGTKKCAELKIYFSEINGGVFFCEVLESPKKKKGYKDRPHFGKSYIYMFEVKEGEVHLMDVKEIMYN